MTAVPVIYWNANPDAAASGYWAQGFYERLMDGTVWPRAYPLDYWVTVGVTGDNPGAVVFVPADWNAGNVAQLNDYVARLDWVLLILTGDEAGAFPWWEIQHPNRRVWAQGGRPQASNGVDRPIGLGPAPAVQDALAKLLPLQGRAREMDACFVGQTTHTRRAEAVAALCEYVPEDRRLLVETSTFGGQASPQPEGLNPDAYAMALLMSKVVLCPSGPATPDTFRLYEALEAGCVPVADEIVASGTEIPDFFSHTLGGSPPFPIVKRWEQLRHVVPDVVHNWPEQATRCRTWWQQYKRDSAYRLDSDVRALQGVGDPPPRGLSDLVTVVVVTSPTSFHPDTSHLEQTVDSARERLPGCEVLIGADGVPEPLAHLTGAYWEYRYRITELCAQRWPGVLLWCSPDHVHQAAVTRELLTKVHTPLILFLEHDTPLVGDAPWADLAGLVQAEEFHSIRLHYGTQIGDYHEHMMLDRQTEPRIYDGVPMVRTYQWSQRPHLASAAWYRWVLDAHSFPGFVEETMHGVVSSAWQDFGLAGWSRYRLGIYAPAGPEPDGMLRSIHLDTRKVLDGHVG